MISIGSAVVVGGAGAVGTMFVEMLTKSGITTTVVDLPGRADAADGVIPDDILNPGPQLRDAVGAADAVLLAVPESVACAAIRGLATLVKPGALVADTTSVKSPVLATWASIDADVQILSLNPMFAPSLGAQGRPIASVVLRDGPRVQALLHVIEDFGSRVVPMSADEHDEISATVQAMTHAAILGFGLALQRSGLDRERLASVAPPPFQALLALLARIAGGNPTVYWDIQNANPRAQAAREVLSVGVENLNHVLVQDESDFAETLRGIGEFFGPAMSEHQDQGRTMLEALPVSGIEGGEERHV